MTNTAPPAFPPTLTRAQMALDPFTEFDRWYQVALTAALPLAHAMTLATATLDGRPSLRVVLLKEVTPAGFVFFTT